MPKGPFVFDSHALLKFFQKEKGYEKVVDLLEEIRKTGATKFLNVINLGEIICVLSASLHEMRRSTR
jgi:PIN domain nuclease of toxin-antitoxin system